MSWNYRVVAEMDSNKNYFYSIRDVYYNKDKPNGWGAEPQYAVGENPTDVYNDLSLMQKAFQLPVLFINKNGKTVTEGKAKNAINEPQHDNKP